jgi:diguanylate cyclase (GGDEF)-like protein
MTRLTDSVVSKRSTVAFRLLLVFVVGLLPVIGFFVYWIETERREAHDAAAAWVRDRAEEIAVEHQHFLQQIRHTLEMVAVTGSRTIDEPAECQRLLLDVRQRRGWMKDAWIVDVDGGVLCSTDPASAPPVLDTEHHEALEQSGFAITEVRRDADDNSHHVVAAMLAGRVIGAHRVLIETTVDIGTLNQLDGEAGDRTDALVMTLDRKGRVMAHSNDSIGLIGKAVDSHPTISRLLDFAGAIHIGTLHDDVERILTSVQVPGWGSTIIVGLGRDSVLATSQRDLLAALMAMLAILMTTGGMAWLSGTQLLLRPVREVRDAALSMAQGNFGRRVRSDRGPREVQEMGRAFNSMADRLEGLALNDELTGLPNRRVLESHVASLAKGAQPYALLSIDLDGFKPVNDRFGHAAGDETLKEIARRLMQSVKGTGLCARVGGDEFVGVLSGLDSGSLALRAVALAERIRSAVAAPIRLEDGEVTVASSIGIAVRSDGSADVDTLMQNADRALYAAKAAGRNQVVVFDGTQPEVEVHKRLPRLPAASTAAA